MAWQLIGTATLINGGDTMGWCHFEYDDSSSEPRFVRLRIEGRSGYSWYCNFDDVTVDGNNVGSWQNLTQNSGAFWSGYVSGGRNVTASWTNPWWGGTQYPSTAGYLPSAGTAPTDLTATLVDFGPDWAQIAVSVSSYGTPSTSANRYIEAGVCQGPNYGGPYKYATAQAVTSNTFTISNTSPGGSMTIAPNTSYIYGGYATNNTVDVATVGGTFVTLPSAPVLSAIDMGGGQIEVDVTHAAEGSAYQVTEEYSVDGGTTWNQILNNKFSLLLNAQTVVTVRRVSTAGASTSTITISPQFNVAVYASVLNKSKLVTKVYAPKASPNRQMISISSVTDSQYATVPEGNYETLKTMIVANGQARQAIAANPSWGYCDISLYHKSSGAPMYALYFHLRLNSTPGSSPDSFATLVSTPPTGSFSDFVSACANYGVVVDSSYENGPTDVDTYLPVDAAFGYPDVSNKVAKIYASVAGKTKLVFEDI